MRNRLLLILFLTLNGWLLAQSTALNVERIDLEALPLNSISHFWLHLIDDGFGQAVNVPVLVARGIADGPVVGLTAALHGNEVNGIGVIQEVFADLDLSQLSGSVVAVPGLNAISLALHQRRYIDEEDLNRNFPGKANGNRSQQYVWQIKEKILPLFDYLIDMHTASFGRENTLYVRADMTNPITRRMALAQDADIILNNAGIPSANEQIAATRTMRAEAVLMGIPTITVEYGNPQVLQPEMIKRGKTGVKNLLFELEMLPGKGEKTKPAINCKKSYWIYLDKGGYLDVTVGLGEVLEKGALIGILRNPFGELIKEYFCPEAGVVIGKSSNPINRSGGRIIHLGIVEE